jgi:hypothetical protein
MPPPRAGHALAVAAQGLHPPRPRHAGPHPRGRSASAHRRRQPAGRPADRDAARFGVHDPEQRSAPHLAWPTRGAGVRAVPGRGDRDAHYRTVVERNAESRLAPQRRVVTIARRPERAQRLAAERAGRSERRQLQRLTPPTGPTDPSRRRRSGGGGRCPIGRPCPNRPATRARPGSWPTCLLTGARSRRAGTARPDRRSLPGTAAALAVGCLPRHVPSVRSCVSCQGGKHPTGGACGWRRRAAGD